MIFGGMSTENEISVISAKSVLKNLDREKYQIYPIYIDKQGEWYKYIENSNDSEIEEEIRNKKKITNIIEYSQRLYSIYL